MAVIFWDFDGTLMHSNSLWSNTVYNALKSVDNDTAVSFTAVRKCMAKGFTWHTPDNDYSKMTGSKWWDFMINKISKDYISLGVPAETAETAAKKVPVMIKNSENYIVYDDTVQTLTKSIACGNKNVVLSNNFPDLADVIKALGFAEYFDDIIVSACIGYDKPRNEIFAYVKSRYPNEQYIMVGDSVTADIAGGNQAGMKTILVHNGFASHADLCVDSLSDIDFHLMQERL